MMKKLLFLYLFTAVTGISVTFGQASCTTDFSCLPAGATEGICPDSATGLPSAVLSVAYNITMSVKIPASYTYSGTTYNLTHFGITEVTVDTSAAGSGTYVPLTAIGLNYMGSGSNMPSGGANAIPSYTMTRFCYWAAPSSACVVVSGTPTKVGTFPVKIKSQIRTVVLGSGIWIPAPDNTEYKIVVAATAGVNDLAAKFEVKQNQPNPFSLKSEITFTTQNANEVEFKVYNMLGKVVSSRMIKADKGSNTIELDASSFSPGIYMYSIKNGDKTITKRMIVSGK
jgi:hypothetical protein